MCLDPGSVRAVLQQPASRSPCVRSLPRGRSSGQVPVLWESLRRVASGARLSSTQARRAVVDIGGVGCRLACEIFSIIHAQDCMTSLHALLLQIVLLWAGPVFLLAECIKSRSTCPEATWRIRAQRPSACGGARRCHKLPNPPRPSLAFAGHAKSLERCRVF